MAQPQTSKQSNAAVQPTLKDQITSFKIALILVIEEYLKNDRKPKFEREQYSEKEERDMLILLLQLVQSSDLDLKDLMYKLADINKPQLVEAVTQRLQELRCEGVGAVMDLMICASEVLFDPEADQQPLLHKSSVIGLFIRRMILAFEVLTFQEVTKVYKSYTAFLDSWNKRSNACEAAEVTASNDTSQFDASMSLTELNQSDSAQPADDTRHQNEAQDSMHPAYQPMGRHSQKQAEFFIAQQTALLQHNEMQALTPKQMQTRIAELLASNPDMAQVHYLSYLNNLRVNEYCSALESLYHYFDRQQTLSGPAPSAANRNKADAPEEGPSRGFRYAALNLASLHYRFGHRSEAMAAIQECIRVAQEANDNVCLQHALTWLHRLGGQQSGTTAYILDRLVSKSADSNLPYLTSLGVQAFAKHNAVSTAKPSSIFEFIVKSDILNCQHSQSDLMCVSYAQKAALWHMYGNREMCSLNSQLMLHLNTSDLGIFHNAEAECLALCHLARHHSDQGDYESAFEILLCTKLRFPANSKYCQIWMQQEHLLNFRRAMHHGNHVTAEQAILNLASVNEQEARLCRCMLMKDRGESTEALRVLHVLLDQCQQTKDRPVEQPHFFVRLLMLKAELLYSVGQPAEAIAPLLQSLTLCQQHHFAQLATLTALHLAFVQYLLGMPQAALRSIEGVLLSVLAHSCLYDRARAQLLWVKCRVACAKEKPAVQKQTALSSCIQVLNDVVKWLDQTEAHRRRKDAIYLQARIYHELGYLGERNRCALQFKELDQLYPSWHATTVCVL